MQLNRRSFVALGGGVLLAETIPSQLRGVGLIGSGSRGQYLMSVFKRAPNLQIRAVCDVYEPNLSAGISAAGSQAITYQDYRSLLASKEIDIVIIATPEHWHHRMCMDALAAGKDVYIEKPLCQTPEQGVELVEAARNSKSIVQVGMQRRSFELFHKARAIKQSGALGVVRMVRSWWLNNGIQPIENPKLAGNLDWEKWQGPAPRRPFDPARFLDWRNYSDYSGGMVADQGAHIYDGIHLVMDAGYPTAVNASSGRPHKPGVDLPESVVVAAEYPQDFVAVFTINYAAMKYKNPNDQINQFDGDQARMDVARGSLKVFKQGAEEEAAMEASGSFDKASEKHVENFLECVRTRAEPNAPVEKGFHAALVVQMANISLKLGRRVRWNPSLRKVEV